MSDDPVRFSGKVLVVDDDAALLMVVREVLEQAGYEVLAVTSGEVALTSLENFLPDIVLLDVLMPEMDGYATCLEIAKHQFGADIPILMMTGLRDLDSIQRAYTIGATDFITKPIHWFILPYRVQYIIRSSKTNKKLKQSEARLSHAQTIARLGSWEWDITSDTFSWTNELLHILAIDPLLFDGTFQAFLNAVHPADKEFVDTSVKTAITTRRPLSIDHQITMQNGVERFVSTEAEIQFNSAGCPCKMSGTMQDITERKQAEKKIRHLAYHDTLTGLPNRILFNERVERALSRAKRLGVKFALLFMDLDRFKLINDTLGHNVGDVFLKKVAERLQKLIRDTDYLALDSSLIARFGGDEFTILLEGVAAQQDASKVAQRFLEDINTPITLDDHALQITTSIGISIFPDDGTDAVTLIKNADSAMYFAKMMGKNNFQFYAPELNKSCEGLSKPFPVTSNAL